MRLHSLLECLIEMRIPVYDCKVNVLKICQFSYFTVDGTSDVILKKQFVGNSNKKGQLSLTNPRDARETFARFM